MSLPYKSTFNCTNFVQLPNGIYYNLNMNSQLIQYESSGKYFAMKKPSKRSRYLREATELSGMKRDLFKRGYSENVAEYRIYAMKI